jgi:hypothetical protein
MNNSFDSYEIDINNLPTSQIILSNDKLISGEIDFLSYVQNYLPSSLVEDDLFDISDDANGFVITRPEELIGGLNRSINLELYEKIGDSYITRFNNLLTKYNKDNNTLQYAIINNSIGIIMPIYLNFYAKTITLSSFEIYAVVISFMRGIIKPDGEFEKELLKRIQNLNIPINYSLAFLGDEDSRYRL